MWGSTPILNPEQIEELSSMVHGILEENKKKLEDALSESVEIESTSVLALYRLAAEEWNKKQKIVDNLCHFSLTMMATVQLLWEHKFEQEERIETAQAALNALQQEVFDLTDLNDMYKQKISEAETKIETIADAKEKIEELVKSQSCIAFDEEGLCSREHLLDKQCSNCEQHRSLELETTELIHQNSKILVEKDSELQNLRLEKLKLEQQLEQAIEESQLTKMELELAEIAIKDALTYKTSYKSLLEQNPSRLSEMSKPKSNIHYYEEEVDEPAFEDSFRQGGKNLLSNEFTCREDIIHFASTPCLLLNESVEKLNLDSSLSSLKDDLDNYKRPENPFKKKAVEPIPKLPSQLESNERPAFHDRSSEEHSKTFDLKNESNHSSLSDAFAHPESEIIDERRINELINRFKIKQSKISDKEETEESSLLSESPLRVRGCEQKQRVQQQSEITCGSNSLSNLYSFVRNKVVKSRIKVK